MKTVSYANVVGFFGALGLLVITRATAIGESQLTASHYWVAVVGGVLLTVVGIWFSTIPKWVKVIYGILQIVVLCICIFKANSIHEILCVLALVSLMLLFIPIVVWLNRHMMLSTKR